MPNEDSNPTVAMLRRRAELYAEIRRFFDQRGFLEVDTPLLSADTVVDRHIEPIAIHAAEVGYSGYQRPELWLQTSPEFAMKRLLVIGATAIYQIAHAFRAGEAGTLHNPEFTMLEWYQVGDGYHQGMQLLSDFAEATLKSGPCDLVSYAEAFEFHAGVADVHNATVGQLQSAARANGIEFGSDWNDPDPDSWRNLILAELVEPKLGSDNPAIVYDWPASQAALAKTRAADPPVAERFELFFHGCELANGYHELQDADELIRRNQENNCLRQLAQRRQLPEESRLLDAMREGLPTCSGVALGVDRLLMALTGSESIGDVMAFPIERA